MYGLCYRGVLTMREDNKLEIIKRMNRRNIITILVCILLIVLLISFFSKKGDGKVKTQIKTTLDSIVEKSDLFVLGIDIFNLLFKGTEKSLEEYYEKIEKSVKDDDLKDLLEKLIVIDAHKRIDWNDYFNHPFFNIDEIDFDKIENIKK